MKKAVYQINFKQPGYYLSDNNGKYSAEGINSKYRKHHKSRYVVGIIYEDLMGEPAFYDFWDDDLGRIKERAFDIIKYGHTSYPSIPITASPMIAYLFDTEEDQFINASFQYKDRHHA
jgi:hypothetical protein